MRKNVIALMLLLPLLFVLSVFSSVKTVSLTLPVSASGIEILDRPESGYRIDLATYRGELCIRAKVLPEGASNREYLYLTEEGSGVTVDEEGVVHAERTGESRITVKAKDGGFEDSVPLFVYSSRPYALACTLSSFLSDSNLLSEEEEGYFARLPIGRYAFSAKSLPAGDFERPDIEVLEGHADLFSDSILLPFSGRTVLSVSLKSMKGGKEILLRKKIELETLPLATDSKMAVNGGSTALVVDRESDRVSFYVESQTPFEVEKSPHLTRSEISELSAGKYLVTVYFKSERSDFSFRLLGEAGEEEVTVTFEPFDFTLRSELPVQSGEETSLLVGSTVTFYAMPSVSAEEITYEWRCEGVGMQPSSNGASCLITPERIGEYSLEVRAFRRGIQLDLFPKELKLHVIRQVRTVQFSERTDLGLARQRTVGGLRYEKNVLLKQRIPLQVTAYGEGGSEGLDDLTFTSSDEGIARLEQTEEGLFLIPTGRGEVTIGAAWRGNATFGTDVGTSMKLYVVQDGVSVSTSPELYRAAEEGRIVVLERDILLGTDENGAPLPQNEREKLLKTMDSTFNTQFYANAEGYSKEQAKIKYGLEFKADLFGNGHALNAELLTLAKDGAGQPLWFRGPLVFVAFGQVATVAAQDNAAFLVRTDGVSLYNVTLLGCGDEQLGEGGYDLSALNTSGTVLELAGSASLINCRVRNGRNVVRAYGGSGEYFSETLTGEILSPMKVLIEGCILSQGREFLLKIGANRALRANALNGTEPDLKDGNGVAYLPRTKIDDEYFRQRYVMTDVVLKDSVLERSGFFCVGLECNFSGELLKEGNEDELRFDGWAGTGGTSFASSLTLSGGVRLYDWKDLSLIDSSTLIETDMPELKLDVAAMLTHMAEHYPTRYGKLIEREGDRKYVHGGIAFYGGGKNYAQIRGEREAGLEEYLVNLSVLGEAEGNTGYQGQILPAAAGTQDFRFLMYDAESLFCRAKQLSDEKEGIKYSAVQALSPPAEGTKKMGENQKKE